MTFLNPLILLGLVAAAVPLIIHLFNFRKPRRVEFSSLAFLREVERSTMQRVRIKQWLLLALRTLAIAAMVIAFARPTLRGQLAGAFAGAAPVAVAVVVDTSPSMQQRDAGGAYMDQALALAGGILADTDSRDEVAVLGLASSAIPTLGPGGETALRRLEGLSVGPGGQSAITALAAASDLLANAESQNRELYFIGDLQASTLLDTTAARINPATPVFLLPVGAGSPDNVGVSNVELRSRIVEADQPLRLAATLTNHGSSPAASYVTSVYLAGDRVAQATSNLEVGVEAAVEFSVTPASRGWLAGTVQTEDDAFPDDNTAYFALNVPEDRSVLLVGGDGQDLRFLRAALQADPTVSIDLQTIRENQLPSVDLGSVDVVVLAGLQTLSSGESDRLVAFVEAGGGLLLFPGAGARIPDYNALLAGLGGGQIRSISAGDGTTVDVVDRVDLEHPLFEGILDTSVGELERPSVYRRAVYQPGTRTESTLMDLSSGSPFLQEIRHGRGGVLLLAVAPDISWSDLPTRGLFLPLLYRSVFLLSSSQTSTGEVFEVGDAADLLLPGVAESAAVSVLSPSGLESAPPRRTGVGGTLVSLTGLLEEPGHYEVRVDGVLHRLVAVNVDTRESALALAQPAEAASLLAQRSDAPITPLDVSGSEPIADTVAEARRGADLWNVFLALALLFLAAEMIVAKQWTPETTT
ncbi:MAG: VWA domain-containing protein [Rhodothermales bacterium]|nr:VWA domain-containing protein [Rhodothermales bacterium]